jgi:putative integral membrane protein (TIGR02587 family)
MATDARALPVPNGAERAYALGLARAFGGAIIFGLPLLMTMEMWALGFAAGPGRLLLFLAFNFAVLTGLSRFGGFEKTSSIGEDVMDALAAYGVGVIASAAVLLLFGLLTLDMPLDEIVGKIALQSVPTSFGAMIARKQLAGGEAEDADEDDAMRAAGYGGQLFLMMAGALFLAFSAAPTEEMILIGFTMTPWHALALVAVSILVLHGFVFAVGFGGQEDPAEGAGFWRTFLGYTIAGYGMALLVSLYVLWTFGRTDGAELAQIVGTVTVLGFPAAVGAAIARLVV